MVGSLESIYGHAVVLVADTIGRQPMAIAAQFMRLDRIAFAQVAVRRARVDHAIVIGHDAAHPPFMHAIAMTLPHAIEAREAPIDMRSGAAVDIPLFDMRGISAAVMAVVILRDRCRRR
jgi:hypothetical protein